MKLPLVSICIPTYNGEKYLQEALSSVKAQTYKNIEVIISDDASKDKTLEICERFKKEVNFPVHIYHHKPAGIGANWNHSITKANGEFIKFLFQDDILEADCLEKMLQVFKKEPDVKLVACKRKFINNNTMISNEEMNEWIIKFGNLQKQFEPKENKEYFKIDKSLFKRNDFFTIPSNKIGEPSVVMFRKSIINKIGYFNNNLKQILDYEYWYRVLKQYPIAIISEELVKFRIHDLQETNINRSRKINDYEHYFDFQFKHLFFLLNKNRQKEILENKFPIIKKLLKYYYKIRY